MDGDDNNSNEVTSFGEESKVKVVFVTKDEAIRVIESPLAVPVRLGRYGLSEVINHLLNTEKPRPFDFMIDQVFIRTSLAAHIRKYELSEESELTIEYMLAVSPPEESIECEHDDWISSISGSKRGVILTGSYDRMVRIWNQNNGELLASLVAHDSAIKSVAWLSADSFVSSSKDRLVRSWKIEESVMLKLFGESSDKSTVDSKKKNKGKEKEGDNIEQGKKKGTTTGISPIAIFEGHEGSVDCVDVNPSQTRVVSGSYDKTIKIWDPLKEPTNSSEKSKKKRRTNALKVNSLQSLMGHAGAISSVKFPTHFQILSGSLDNTIRIWDVATSSIVTTINSVTVVNQIDFSTEARLIASAHTDRFIRIWDPRESEEKATHKALSSHFGWGSGVAWHPKQPYQLVSSSYDSTVKLWDIRSIIPLYTIKACSELHKVLAVNWSSLSDVSESEIVSGGSDNKMKIHKPRRVS